MTQFELNWETKEFLGRGANSEVYSVESFCGKKKAVSVPYADVDEGIVLNSKRINDWLAKQKNAKKSSDHAKSLNVQGVIIPAIYDIEKTGGLGEDLPYSVMDYIDGIDDFFDEVLEDLSDTERTEALEKLAVFLNTLHQSKISDKKESFSDSNDLDKRFFWGLKVEDDEKQKLYSKYGFEDAVNFLKKRMVNEALEKNQVFAHRDLTSGNVRYADGKIVIIDWEHAGPCNPYFEFQLLEEGIPGGFLKTLLDIYNKLPKTDLDYSLSFHALSAQSAISGSVCSQEIGTYQFGSLERYNTILNTSMKKLGFDMSRPSTQASLTSKDIDFHLLG